MFDDIFVSDFMSKVDKTTPTDCWTWTGPKDRPRYGDASGYSSILINKKRLRAHRISYQIHRGAIPDGLILDHLCRNPICVNPDHLEPVTIKENTARGNAISAINSAKTHCLNGHEFSGDNLRITYSKSGTEWRRCRICDKARDVVKYERRKAKAMIATHPQPSQKDVEVTGVDIWDGPADGPHEQRLRDQRGFTQPSQKGEGDE